MSMGEKPIPKQPIASSADDLWAPNSSEAADLSDATPTDHPEAGLPRQNTGEPLPASARSNEIDSSRGKIPPPPASPDQGNPMPFAAVMAVVLLSVLVGAAVVWIAIRQFAPRPHPAASASVVQPLAASSLNRSAVAASNAADSAPVSLPEQVLAEAAMLRGEIFARGTVALEDKEISIEDSLATLDRNRTSLRVYFFGAKLRDEERELFAKIAASSDATAAAPSVPLPLLTLATELSPFGSDCSPLGVKRYQWIINQAELFDPALNSSIKIARNPQSQDLSEFKKLDCERRPGGTFTLHSEGSARAALPPRVKPKVGKSARAGDTASVWWRIETRQTLR